MLIPDCRLDESYNEDFLDKSGKDFIRGYDWCAMNAVDNAFDNMGALLDGDSSGCIEDLLSKEVPEHLRKECEVILYDGTVDKRQIQTYGYLFRNALLEYVEMERDQMITSMIDNMEEEEYERLRKAAMEENAKAEHPKEYYNTRRLYAGTKGAGNG